MSNNILIGGKPLTPEGRPSQAKPGAKVIIKGSVKKTKEGGIEINTSDQFDESKEIPSK
jgi:hypothetical protein